MPSVSPSSARPADAGPAALDRGAWHRRASRPILMWMAVLIVVVFVHRWLPQSRWLMVHMVTLGIITTSILVWGQHVTEALLKVRLGEEARTRQLQRIRLLTAGIVVTIAGMLPSWPWLVVLGALMVSSALVWYAAALGAQLRAAIAARFRFTVTAYIAAASLLPVGATLGALMAFGPGEPWQGRLLLAHQVVNLLGFVGITVSGTLLTLWPTVLRTKIELVAAQRAAKGLQGMFLAVLGATVAALIGSALLGAVLVLIYLGCFAWLAVTLVRLALRSARQERSTPLSLFPVLSIAAGAGWFVLAVIALLVLWWGSADAQLASSLAAAEAQRLTVPFVAGFLLQVLFGAMSHLLPVSLRGGPRSTKAALEMMSRGAVVRVVGYNLALALFVLAGVGTTWADAVFSALTLGTAEVAGFGSLSRVLVSLLAVAVLVSFVVLMVLGVRAGIRHRGVALPAPSGTPGPGTPADGLPGAPADGLPGAPSGAAAGSPAGGSAGAPPGARSPAAESSPARVRARVAAEERRMDRRSLTGVLLGAGSVLGVTALGGALDRAGGAVAAARTADGGTAGTGSAGTVASTGETTTLAVSMADMRFTPDRLEVPAGNALVVELRNDDPHEVHDLVLATGATSGRLQPGDAMTVEAGVITEDVEGWCSIVGHRAMGMVLTVVAVGAAAAPAGSGDAAPAADELAPVRADLQAAPGDTHTVRDARLPEPAGAEQRLTLEVQDLPVEIAPGVTMEAMTYGGTVVGPVLRSEIGARLTVDLVNHGMMGHSLDLHAGRAAPDEVMRTIPPGESLTYAITTEHAGIWLYHCSTMPMTVHLSAGMIGALVVTPAGLAPADREYVLVQSEHYLIPEGAPGHEDAVHEGAHPVSTAKIATERPDVTVFNGHATQYVHAPLEARVGERVRLWVLAAGPSRGISFHVVGGVFDTVFKEGEYLLRPENDTAGGAQSLDLAAAQGGFVELEFDEPGTYTAVNHSFVEMERGARALIRVTA
ncbi:multicopper oxidase domain-containing protein [Brachybacterium saurashtrense]|uniref:Copper oxidase n=1 Tax=Brachybacterium saurashtrense TaxID=556288 RepID=A0A345YKM4_9MICO|nr:multicopper oxidase domain-containing protein [Brachybacterium saurashtrense]AXK44476.1 copper oxidase [Brachybacterium saurashtrense]RRR23088.1 copper oxidase [Brachybacterium saurashtrense]